MKIINLIGLLTLSPFLYGQEFSKLSLSDLETLTTELDDHFVITETDAVQPFDSPGVLYISNDLRSPNFINTNKWLEIKDQVEVDAIDIIFSKYPIRDGKYQMYMPLLQKRLINLFKIDSLLNDELISWNIVLQTDCRTDHEADALFHGVRVNYFDPAEEHTPEYSFNIEKTDSSSTESKSGDDKLEDAREELNSAYSEQGSLEDLEADLLAIEKELPLEVSAEMKGESLEKRLEITAQYLENVLDTLSETDLNSVDQEYLEINRKKVQNFINRYERLGKKNNVVEKVLDRHEEWSNALVIADWTGSMYGYGAEVLLWHINNFESSGITYFTLFNDGDRKIIKRIGDTEGIYFEKANNVERLMVLYDYVKARGGGGDAPENDIEAILRGMEKYPSHSEVILIADNHACVRDIELANLIEKPVRIILCGYSRRTGVNPNYIHLAKITGGSIHTIEDDISGKSLTKLYKGNSKSFSCFQSEFFSSTPVKDRKLAKKNKELVRHIDFSGQDLGTIPFSLGQHTRLVTLDLSSNHIRRTGGALVSLRMLQELNLSNNNLKKVDASLTRNQYLVKLDLSHNRIVKVEKGFEYQYLTHLNLSNNQIDYIPFIKCKMLEELDLSNNQMRAIPIGLKYAKKLKKLNLSGNSLEGLSRDLKYLKKLEELDLSNCNLTTLSKSIFRLRHLKVLDIRGNDISEKEIKRIKHLRPKLKIIV